MSENGKNVSPGDPRYFEIQEFLLQEAELLDNWHFSEWLELMTEDIHYRMPVRLNRGRTLEAGIDERTEIFSENLASLRMRV